MAAGDTASIQKYTCRRRSGMIWQCPNSNLPCSFQLLAPSPDTSRTEDTTNPTKILRRYPYPIRHTPTVTIPTSAVRHSSQLSHDVTVCPVIAGLSDVPQKW